MSKIIQSFSIQYGDKLFTRHSVAVSKLAIKATYVQILGSKHPIQIKLGGKIFEEIIITSCTGVRKSFWKVWN